MQSKNFGYIPALDHLRGFAALLVLYFHGSHFIYHKIVFGTPYDPVNWPRAGNPLTALAIEGHTAVSLFFVLSGFVFTVGSLDKKLNYVGFYRNRLLRTYPLFLFFLALGVVTHPANFNLWGFLQAVLFMANDPTAFNGGPFTFVFWSIAVEWQFYLLFPLLLYAVQHAGWKVLPLLIMIFLAVRSAAFFQVDDMRSLSYWTLLGRIDQFLIGMLAGIYYRRRFRPGLELDRLGIAAIGGVLLLLFGFNQIGGGGSNGWLWIVWPTLEALAWAVFLIGYLSLARHFKREVGLALVGLGTVSYSIYLAHYVVLSFFMERNLDTVLQLQSPVGTAILNTAVMVMPAVLLVSAATYYGIELPFLVRRRAYVEAPAGGLNQAHLFGSMPDLIGAVVISEFRK